MMLRPGPVLLVLSCAIQGYLGGGGQRKQDGHTRGE